MVGGRPKRNKALLRKVKEYRLRLAELLQYGRIVYSLLNDPE